jgi:hypothetical protein
MSDWPPESDISLFARRAESADSRRLAASIIYFPNTNYPGIHPGRGQPGRALSPTPVWRYSYDAASPEPDQARSEREPHVTDADELGELRAALAGRDRWIRILSVLVALLASFLAVDIVVLVVVLSWT